MVQTIQNITSRFYELDWDIKHLTGDLEYDAWLKNSSGWQDISNVLHNRRNLVLPEPIEYESIEKMLVNTDYPYNKNRFPIMSRRMLSVLTSVGSFSYQEIPAVMIDTTAVYSEEERGYVRTGIKNNNFSLVRIPEYLDIFDWENSVYKLDPDLPGRIKTLTGKKIVLKEPKEGFPPLFRVSAMPYALLVSAETRTALETAGIRGVEFLEPKFLKY
jgi:hypothetical protein